MYDNIVPLILKYRYGISDGISGPIMALDNVLALFMLPLFGTLSDRKGARMPFIVVGTAGAVILTVCLSFAKTFSMFFTLLALLLVSMSIYRSPAVALMPDVTPKPLRSKANAIINLMGALGGVFTLGVTGLLVHAGATGRYDYTMLFLAVSLLMAISVIVLVLTMIQRRVSKEQSN